MLLGRKQRGPGAGLLNGFGGEIEAGELPEDAARRETREEAGGVEILDPVELGMLHCSFEETSLTFGIHVFRVTRYAGVPRNTEEMRPAWYRVVRPPFNEMMWSGDRLWFPFLVGNIPFEGRIHYDGLESRRVLRHRVGTFPATVAR